MIPSHTFLRAVIEGLILPDRSESASARAQALDYAAGFVQDQLRALPLVLIGLLFVGLSVFRLVTWLRWFRGLQGLDLSRRHAWLNAWAYGRVGVARKLFRPLRSLAVLAYFEAVQP
jgi:hypothetical protein